MRYSYSCVPFGSSPSRCSAIKITEKYASGVLAIELIKIYPPGFVTSAIFLINSF